MEAVWRRILILLLVGVLLTILAFPIVRGQGTRSAEIEGRVISERNSTRIKEVYFGPVDSSDPADGRPDFYEDKPEDWVFTYQVLEGWTEETSGNPVSYGTVWLNITMGPYTNSSKAMTDIRGRVHFNFTSRFTDTITGNTFTISAVSDQGNLTIEVFYNGNITLEQSSKTYCCTYRRDPWFHGPDHRILGNLCVSGFIACIIVSMIVLLLSIQDLGRYATRKRILKDARKY